MKTIDRRTTDQQVKDYNDDIQDALSKALTMGSMRRPKSTLAALAGLEANDNLAKGE